MYYKLKILKQNGTQSRVYW